MLIYMEMMMIIVMMIVMMMEMKIQMSGKQVHAADNDVIIMIKLI